MTGNQMTENQRRGLEQLAFDVETDNIDDADTAIALDRLGVTEDDLMDMLEKRPWLNS